MSDLYSTYKKFERAPRISYKCSNKLCAYPSASSMPKGTQSSVQWLAVLSSTGPCLYRGWSRSTRTRSTAATGTDAQGIPSRGWELRMSLEVLSTFGCPMQLAVFRFTGQLSNHSSSCQKSLSDLGSLLEALRALSSFLSRSCLQSLSSTSVNMLRATK